MLLSDQTSLHARDTLQSEEHTLPEHSQLCYCAKYNASTSSVRCIVSFLCYSKSVFASALLMLAQSQAHISQTDPAEKGLHTVSLPYNTFYRVIGTLLHERLTLNRRTMQALCSVIVASKRENEATALAKSKCDALFMQDGKLILQYDSLDNAASYVQYLQRNGVEAELFQGQADRVFYECADGCFAVAFSVEYIVRKMQEMLLVHITHDAKDSSPIVMLGAIGNFLLLRFFNMHEQRMYSLRELAPFVYGSGSTPTVPALREVYHSWMQAYNVTVTPRQLQSLESNGAAFKWFPLQLSSLMLLTYCLIQNRQTTDSVWNHGLPLASTTNLLMRYIDAPLIDIILICRYEKEVNDELQYGERKRSRHAQVRGDQSKGRKRRSSDIWDGNNEQGEALPNQEPEDDSRSKRQCLPGGLLSTVRHSPILQGTQGRMQHGKSSLVEHTERAAITAEGIHHVPYAEEAQQQRAQINERDLRCQQHTNDEHHDVVELNRFTGKSATEMSHQQDTDEDGQTRNRNGFVSCYDTGKWWVPPSKQAQPVREKEMTFQQDADENGLSSNGSEFSPESASHDDDSVQEIPDNAVEVPHEEQEARMYVADVLTSLYSAESTYESVSAGIRLVRESSESHMVHDRHKANDSFKVCELEEVRLNYDSATGKLTVQMVDRRKKATRSICKYLVNLDKELQNMNNRILDHSGVTDTFESFIDGNVLRLRLDDSVSTHTVHDNNSTAPLKLDGSNDITRGELPVRVTLSPVRLLYDKHKGCSYATFGIHHVYPKPPRQRRKGRRLDHCALLLRRLAEIIQERHPDELKRRGYEGKLGTKMHIRERFFRSVLSDDSNKIKRLYDYPGRFHTPDILEAAFNVCQRGNNLWYLMGFFAILGSFLGLAEERKHAGQAAGASSEVVFPQTPGCQLPDIICNYDGRVCNELLTFALGRAQTNGAKEPVEMADFESLLQALGLQHVLNLYATEDLLKLNIHELFHLSSSS